MVQARGNLVNSDADSGGPNGIFSAIQSREVSI